MEKYFTVGSEELLISSDIQQAIEKYYNVRHITVKAVDLPKQIAELKDKLHRRNMQIKDLKATIEEYKKPLQKHYLIKFKGRQNGAIGIVYNIIIDVYAPNEIEAKDRLYDYFEHITNLSIKEV